MTPLARPVHGARGGAGAALLIAFLIAGAPAAVEAQAPSFPYAYIYGRRPDVDLAGPSELPLGDGMPDVSVRLYLQNVPSWVGQSYKGAVRLRSMTLRNKSLPNLAWDTIRGNRRPVLVVMSSGRMLNRRDGSIDGVTLPNHAFLELFVWDTGPLAQHRAGFVIEIVTNEGSLDLDVKPIDINDRSYF